MIPTDENICMPAALMIPIGYGGGPATYEDWNNVEVGTLIYSTSSTELLFCKEQKLENASWETVTSG